MKTRIESLARPEKKFWASKFLCCERRTNLLKFDMFYRVKKISWLFVDLYSVNDISRWSKTILVKLLFSG